MYSAETVLQNIDDNTVLVLLLGGLALGCNFVFFTEAARGSARDRCVPFLLITTAFWFPHDANFLLNFDDWFNQYDHWFPKLFWVALIFTNAFEVVYIAQTLRYGRDELTPNLSQRGFRLYVAGALILGVIIWAVAKGALGDPLYLTAFMVTIVWGLISGVPLALRRGRRGTSTLMWGAFTGMAASFSALSIIVFGGPFDDLPWIALCLAGVAGGVGLTRWLAAAPAHAPPERSAAGRDGLVAA